MSADVRDDECPGCDTSLLGEWDEVLRVFTCPTCSTTWKRRPGRCVPRREPSLLPPPPMTLDSEWDDPERRN